MGRLLKVEVHQDIQPVYTMGSAQPATHVKGRKRYTCDVEWSSDFCTTCEDGELLSTVVAVAAPSIFSRGDEVLTLDDRVGNVDRTEAAPGGFNNIFVSFPDGTSSVYPEQSVCQAS